MNTGTLMGSKGITCQQVNHLGDVIQGLKPNSSIVVYGRSLQCVHVATWQDIKCETVCVCVVLRKNDVQFLCFWPEVKTTAVLFHLLVWLLVCQWSSAYFLTSAFSTSLYPYLKRLSFSTHTRSRLFCFPNQMQPLPEQHGGSSDNFSSINYLSVCPASLCTEGNLGHY